MKICKMKLIMEHGERIRYAIQRHGVINGISQCIIGADCQWISFSSIGHATPYLMIVKQTMKDDDVAILAKVACPIKTMVGKPQSAARFRHERRRSRGGADVRVHGRTGCQSVRGRMNALLRAPFNPVNSVNPVKKGTPRLCVSALNSPRRTQLLLHRETLQRCFLFVLRNYRRFSGTVMLAGRNAPIARSMVLCNVAALNDIYYCNHKALFDIMFGQGGYSHG